MAKRIFKIVAIVLVAAIVAAALLIAHSLLGSPISYALASATAAKHLDDNYRDTDYVTDRIIYNFKDGSYYTHIISPSSTDGSFSIRVSALGELIGDDYEWRVTEHGNLTSRLDAEYRDLVDGLILSEEYPYRVSIGYGTLEFDKEEGEEPARDALDRSELVNDATYDVRSIGKTNGVLVLYIDTDSVSPETASEILLRTRELMDARGVGFYSVDLVLEHPPYDDEAPYDRPNGEIHLRGFLYADIYEDDLLARVGKCIEDTRAYYDEQDELKENEIG